MPNTTGGDGRPWPWSVSDMPTSIKELVGRKVRVVRPGDVITQEYQPGRVTIHITEEHRIGDIKIEPGNDA